VLQEKLYKAVDDFVKNNNNSYSRQDIVNILLKLIADGEV